MMSPPSLIVAISAGLVSSGGSLLPDFQRVATGACSTCCQAKSNFGRMADHGWNVVAVASDVHVAFREWRVPTSGSFPHDPFATRDGAIWYTGQKANLLGRLDPKTGQFREYRLKTQLSDPHGLVSDASGNIWFTASFEGYIGRAIR